MNLSHKESVAADAFEAALNGGDMPARLKAAWAHWQAGRSRLLFGTYLRRQHYAVFAAALLEWSAQPLER